MDELDRIFNTRLSEFRKVGVDVSNRNVFFFLGTRYGYGSGYLSEPEHRLYSDRSATLDSRRRLRNKENDFFTSTIPRK